jgi:dipeptidyl aminopeptidase/acylaminoacyl peptidase
MLFIQGSEDHNVPLVESIQMFTALKILGRETAFVEVAGQDHQILDYHKRFLWQNTIFAWFAKWLKSDAGWWNALYPPKDL